MPKISHQSLPDSSISMLESRLAVIRSQVETLKKEEGTLNKALQSLKGIQHKNAVTQEPKERNRGISAKVEEILGKRTVISVDEICSICEKELQLVNRDGLRGTVQTRLSKMKHNNEAESLQDGTWRKKPKGML